MPSKMTDLPGQELKGKQIHDLAGEQPRFQPVAQPQGVCGQDQEWVVLHKMIGDGCLARTRNTKEANEDWLYPALAGKCQISKYLAGKAGYVHGL